MREYKCCACGGNALYDLCSECNAKYGKPRPEWLKVLIKTSFNERNAPFHVELSDDGWNYSELPVLRTRESVDEDGLPLSPYSKGGDNIDYRKANHIK